MRIHIISFALLATLSCSTKTETQTKHPSSPADKVLYEQEAAHNFSSTTDKDSFKIVVKGQSIKDGQFTFQIKKKDGQLILDESYSTTMLLDFGFTGNANDDKAVEEYVKRRLDSFFIEKRFHQPAIDPKDTFEPDHSDKEIWEEIISDQTSVGFHYLLGKEDGRYIAFSKKTGKVVLYYNCC